MTVKLLTEHHLEFQSSKGGCTGSSEYIHVKLPHCWKSHVAAHINMQLCNGYRGLDFYHSFHPRPHSVCKRSESTGLFAINTEIA